MSQLAQSKVELVFPTSKRLTGRRFTEYNIASNNRIITDYDSFVKATCDENSEPFEFVIKGYIFRVTKAVDIIALGTTWSQIWATIELTSAIDTGEIKGQDDGTYYTGLNFSGTDQTGGLKYSLLLFEKDTSGNFKVPTASLIKISGNSIGGTIDPIVDGEAVN